jgi:hypothetical protein
MLPAAYCLLTICYFALRLKVTNNFYLHESNKRRKNITLKNCPKYS